MAAACPGSHRLSWDFGPGFWWPHNGGRPGPAVLPRSRHAAPGVAVQWVVVALSLGRARTLLAPARPLPSQPSPLGHASDCRAPCAALSPPGLSGSGFPGWGSAAEGAPHPQGGEVAARRRGAGPAAVRRLRPAPRAGRNLSRPFVFRAEAWAPALTDAPHGLLCRPSSLHCTHFTRLQTHGPLSPPLPFPGPLVSR